MEITREEYNNAVALETAETIQDALNHGYDPWFLNKFQKSLIAHCELVGRRLFNDGPDRKEPAVAAKVIPIDRELEHLRQSQAPGGCVSIPDSIMTPSEQLEAELEPRPGRYHVG
jgi:hypothetical protein